MSVPPLLVNSIMWKEAIVSFAEGARDLKFVVEIIRWHPFWKGKIMWLLFENDDYSVVSIKLLFMRDKEK